MKSFPLSRKDLEDFFGANAKKISRLAHVKVANSPGHESISVENREGTDSRSGTNARLMWGARTDVGLVREHNEDSFLVQPPLFAVCDGMGGHAAGEVASFIAVETIGKQAPHCANDVLLGASVEAANTEIIHQAAQGHGKPGMGCTASCALIENNKIAIAHVGDSRIYLLHNGSLVRLTHDHSFVEELVDAGEITADEARVHPSRSIITRALGSDPDMYADHFKLDINTGDRIIICSDGLSSMIEDAKIESLAVSAVHPQSCADNLVAAALEAGGLDNVTVVVVDIKDDGAPQKKQTHAHETFMHHWRVCTFITYYVFVHGSYGCKYILVFRHKR
ncbi:Stp1/IreP family PP2C-type Ser/Thr phosphatase [Fannyhessea vaginae]|uniref:Stp1/IreP family PP2C-type Ser/Thr phosphatase n=1 Tax=Fannyhessea vaginae TaxID=82135 RepID=UPI000AB7EA00|nr:Stp1/IreP family PP2C-type Ser/Thr phosphatase [Fannyhessea vaginae]